MPHNAGSGADRSGIEQQLRSGGGHFDVVGITQFTGREHLDLELWSIDPESCHLRLGDGLDYVVDMHGIPSGVRPEAVVHLFSSDELGRHSRSPKKQWSEFDGFVLRKIGYCSDMTLRLHDQCSNAERSDTVLNEPVVGPMD